MKPELTKDQRKRLAALARLLDRIPKKRFDIGTWGQWINLKERSCKTAACACGWGMTSPFIRGTAFSASQLRIQLLTNPKAESGLFGYERIDEAIKPTPKSVAVDIRRYLRNGKLPQEA